MPAHRFRLGSVAAILIAASSTSAQTTMSDRLMKKPIFTGCTAEEQATLTRAEFEASAALDGALTGLKAELSDIRQIKENPRFTEWFGHYESSRFQKVKSTFAQIRIHTWVNQIHAHCGDLAIAHGKCDKDEATAYVFRGKAYDVAFCPKFFKVTPKDAAIWGLSNSVLAMQAGILLHELSHFDVNGHTDDLDYTATDARKLAEEHSPLAIENADNFHYFAASFLPDSLTAPALSTIRLAPADTKDPE
jgi:peptidyl-Lys metalloendopeptidase